MALVVEDGTGLANAESLASVAFVTAFLGTRGKTTFTGLGSDTQREQCLRNVSDYMLQTYRGSWKGYRSSTTQALDWPRNSVELDDIGAYYGYDYGFVIPYNVVPVQIQQANALFAEIAAGIDGFELAVNLDRLVKREKFDVFETEYADAATPYTIYRAPAMLLAPFLETSGSMVRLVRT